MFKGEEGRGVEVKLVDAEKSMVSEWRVVSSAEQGRGRSI